MLHTHLQVREDNWQLFGFAQSEQLTLFRHLLAVSGIGAKTALAIVDNIAPHSVMQALSTGDYQAFCKVPGVGKKTAQRLVIDLKDKFKLSPADSEVSSGGLSEIFMAQAMPDLLLTALEQLGYKGAEARALALKARQNRPEEQDINKLLQEALSVAAKL